MGAKLVLHGHEIPQSSRKDKALITREAAKFSWRTWTRRLHVGEVPHAEIGKGAPARGNSIRKGIEAGLVREYLAKGIFPFWVGTENIGVGTLNQNLVI